MTVIKAPYNFVPFNHQVVTPHWIDQISHDIPFKDGLSGKIEVKLTAMSPIFVRDGIGQAASAKNYKDGVQQQAHTFSQALDGRYFIPGTSLKGMIRSVVEILSFGRMEGKVNDHRYAVRDFSNNSLYNPSKISRTIKCGWLQKVKGEYLLTDCGAPRRISHKSLSEYFKTDISTFFQNRRNLGDKSAKMKYEQYPHIPKAFRFDTWDDKNGRSLCRINPEGELAGQIVFTGQPSERQEERGKGKHLEFVFPDRGMPGMSVSDTAIDNFFFAYYDHDTNKQSPDWKYWKPKLEKGEKIPVFFREEGREVKDMGLSMLYKITYENSVEDAIKKYQTTQEPDFSEAIFGHVRDNKEQLRGRVHISHAFSENAQPAVQPVTEVLSGPKASYYPMYIRQKVGANGKINGNYQTFMDKKPEIAGWKRYPVHTHSVKHNPPPSGTNSRKITTSFIPLEIGAQFHTTLRYHNLRPMELGALLSALTFHHTEGTYHALGMAKPLGYGKVKIDILNIDHNAEEALGAFECYMNAALSGAPSLWHQSDQVTALISMSQDQFEDERAENEVLSYMDLDAHITAKKAKEALAPYSQLVHAKPSIPSYCTPEGIAHMQGLIQSERGHASHTDNVEKIANHELEDARGRANSQFESWKDTLLKELKAKQEAIEEAEKANQLQQLEADAQNKRDAKREKYLKEGPDFEGLDPTDTKAYGELIKRMEDFARNYHQQNDKQIRSKEEHPNGSLPEDFRDKLDSWLNRFIQKDGGLKPHDRKQWLKKGLKHSDMKRLAEWVGEENSKTFLNQI